MLCEMASAVVSDSTQPAREAIIREPRVESRLTISLQHHPLAARISENVARSRSSHQGVGGLRLGGGGPPLLIRPRLSTVSVVTLNSQKLSQLIRDGGELQLQGLVMQLYNSCHHILLPSPLNSPGREIFALHSAVQHPLLRVTAPLIHEMLTSIISHWLSGVFCIHDTTALTANQTRHRNARTVKRLSRRPRTNTVDHSTKRRTGLIAPLAVKRRAWIFPYLDFEFQGIYALQV